jgi:hypothetical protein
MKLRVCYDCYHGNANGIDDLELSEERAQEVLNGLSEFEGSHLLHNLYYDPYFVAPRTSPCDVCHSPLGGDRFTLLAEEL